uniref:FANCI solenoid 4 domain-containing protein n=1 Tax=Hanusia phi TaxID=3032 RepID=A0A7S0EJ42_9CRYP|mmetsp:Transcript_23554/g.52932  ORF Transcript_23554/g.52932 Transcript_23554/m.52932 type:complete len:198 (+) Transcript_23554:87-680(+)
MQRATGSKQIATSKIQFPRKPFVHLMHHIGARLNESLYQLVIRYTQVEQERTLKQKISKEERLIPNLIFQVESLEATLIRIQRECKNKLDLMKHFKRSTARDFKIDYSAVMREVARDVEEDCGKKKKGKDRNYNVNDERDAPFADFSAVELQEKQGQTFAVIIGSHLSFQANSSLYLEKTWAARTGVRPAVSLVERM